MICESETKSGGGGGGGRKERRKEGIGGLIRHASDGTEWLLTESRGTSGKKGETAGDRRAGGGVGGGGGGWRWWKQGIRGAACRRRSILISTSKRLEREPHALQHRRGGFVTKQAPPLEQKILNKLADYESDWLCFQESGCRHVQETRDTNT